MAKAILMKGGSGGVTSNDVTASKAQVLQGYRTITSDSDDEVVEGTIPVRGYHGPDSGEMWLFQQEGGYVVRFEEGYYQMGGNRQWKPYVIAPTALVKSAVNYHPEYTLNNTMTCGEQGQVKMINTQDNGYTINQAKVLAIDGGRGKLVMIMGHGNAYYFRNDGNPHVEANASELGNAVKESVLQGQTASSQYGIKFEGAIPRWICGTGDVISAVDNNGFAWDDVTGANRGRGIVTRIANGQFIQGANYVFLPSPNLYPWNIRAGVNIHGITGTLQDYGAGRVAFRNATFDGVLISGVANKGFILRGIPRFLNFKNTSNGYLGIQDGGMKFLNFYGGNTRQVSAPDVGCVLAHSINLSPFRYIKVGYKVFRFIGDGTAAQPARVSFEIGVAPISNAGGESYNPASNTVLKDIGGTANSASHVMTSTRPSAGDQSDHSQLYLTLDVSANQGHHFLYFLLGNIIHEYSNGVVSSNVVVNYIEFIN